MFSCMFTRISVTLLLKRLFGINKMRILGLYCLIGIIFITSVPVEVANLVQCYPMQAAWDHTTSGVCWRSNVRNP